MPKDIFSKIMRDYNNSLEKILEKKDFSVEVKNLLLSMLYRIENAFDDYKKVKVNVCTKQQFIQDILEIIERDCKKIEIIKPTTEEGKKLYEQNINSLIDKENGTIKTFQNEKSILEALLKLKQREIEILPQYEIVSGPIKEMLLQGNLMNNIEIITDFNGWSWDVTTHQNTVYNKVYQLLIMLIGNKKIDKWICNRRLEENDELDELPNNLILSSKYNESFGITKSEIKGKEKDYIEEIMHVLEANYGEKLAHKFIDESLKICIYEYYNNNTVYKEKIDSRVKELNEELKKMNDNKKYLELLSEDKKNIAKEIKKIDTLIISEEKLKKEYDKINSNLPNDKKIFSVSHFKLMLEKQRKNKLDDIQEINRKMEPKVFVEIKNEIEKKVKFYEDIKLGDKSSKNILRLHEKIDKAFIKCFEYGIENSTENKKIENLVYKFRYFEYIKPISNIKKEIIESIERKLIEKCCSNKIITTISENKEINYQILKTIFDCKVIDLDTLNISMKYNKGILIINIYDDKTHEEERQIEITEKVELCVRLNKKIKIFS